MDQSKVIRDANSLFNSDGENIYCARSNKETREISVDPVLKRWKKAKHEIAYEKFTESTLNDIEIVDPCNVELNGSKSDKGKSVSIDILHKIQNIEQKLEITESIWANALKQLSALNQAVESVKSSNKQQLLGEHEILIVLPIKTIEELKEFEKAVSNSNAVIQTVNGILKDGDQGKFNDNHAKFIKWNVGKLIKPQVANDVSWANPNKFQLKNSAFIKMLIKYIHTKFPMLTYTYIVENIVAVLTEFRSISKTLKHNSINFCTETC